MYEPRNASGAPLEELIEATALIPLTPELAQALQHSTSIGGARPKALIQRDSVGVSDEHAEEVLNQTKPGIIGVYNKYRYNNEKKTALIK